MRSPELLLLVGLTGVGKSTLLQELAARRPEAQLLPDRRRLADATVLPDAQRLLGEPVGPVRDRAERFRLTAAYRRVHADGMAHALHVYLQANASRLAPEAIFDNLRGVDEVRGAERRFPTARFLVLEASPETRIARLSGRGDAFDQLSDGDGGGPLLRARRIVDEEARHYDPAAARAFLESVLAPWRLLVIDTEAVGAASAAERVTRWWSRA